MGLVKYVFVIGLLCQVTNARHLIQPLNATLASYFSTRIVGGVAAAPGDVPYMVALLDGFLVKTYFCGGSILSNQYILTAAHCIDSMDNGIGVLSPFLHGNIGSNSWQSGGTNIFFESFTNHPQWNPSTVKYDAGVLKTREHIIFSEKVAPVALTYEQVESGTRGVVAGFGRLQAGGALPYYLQKLTVTTLPGELCQLLVFLITGGNSIQMDPETEICAYHSPGHGVCSGDSGSAIVTKEGKYQFGITSWGFPCARGIPDVYTSTHAVRDLLELVLN